MPGLNTWYACRFVSVNTGPHSPAPPHLLTQCAASLAAGEDVKFSPASPRLAAHSGQMTPYRAFGEPLFSLGCSILKIPMSIRRAQ